MPQWHIGFYNKQESPQIVRQKPLMRWSNFSASKQNATSLVHLQLLCAQRDKELGLVGGWKTVAIDGSPMTSQHL